MKLQLWIRFDMKATKKLACFCYGELYLNSISWNP